MVGMRLKAARQKRGLSQQAVAERFGVSDRTVLNWETGRAIPKTNRLSDLAKFYGVSLEWLIDKSAPEKENFHHQYTVIRSDGKTDDPNTKYFVLKVNTDPHALRALRAYQASIRHTNPKMAEEISHWLNNEVE